MESQIIHMKKSMPAHSGFEQTTTISQSEPSFYMAQPLVIDRATIDTELMQTVCKRQLYLQAEVFVFSFFFLISISICLFCLPCFKIDQYRTTTTTISRLRS
jgi:hypothetical protein